MSVELPEMPTVVEVGGPVGEAVFEDRTLQIGPTWDANDYWTTVWNPMYQGDPNSPPYPSIHAWMNVPAGEVARLIVTDERPTDAAWHRVLTTVLSVYKGAYAALGQREGPYDPSAPRTCVELSLPEGDYPIEVWVDADVRNEVRSVAMVVGDRTASSSE